jgi:hypothetical protein
MAGTTTPSSVTPSHEYHAEAHVLSGELQRPITQRIEKHAPLLLKDSRDSHLTRFIEKISIEGLVSFAKGETRVSGSRSPKHNGWVTVSTSILEGLNVFEVIAADRLVAQVSTDHAYENGHEPRVSFLGSQFTNFRVGGFAPQLTLNLGICGDIPAGGKSYFQDAKFLGDVETQTKDIAGKMAKAKGLPNGLAAQYDKKLAYVRRLISSGGTPSHDVHEPLTCSLVQSVGAIPIPGIQIFGHVLVIPDFGTVTLGEIEVSEQMYQGSTKPCVSFQLTNVKMEMGCVGTGLIGAATVKGNGQTSP